MTANMTRELLLDIHTELTQNAQELMDKKNKDYAGASGAQPFANFERVEALGVCSTEKGFLVRVIDKLSRLSSFADAGTFAVEDESLRDTVIDLINYAVLIYAYNSAKQTGSAPRDYRKST